MKSLLEKRDHWGNGYAVWILAGLLFCLPLIFSSLKQIEMKNEVETWLPDSDPQIRLLQWYLATFPAENRAILTWDGSTLDDPRIPQIEALLEGTVDEEGLKRGGSDYIDHVLTPQEVLAKIIAQNVEPDEAMQRLEGVLLGKGPLKIRLTEAGRLQQTQTLQKLQTLAQDQLKKPVTLFPPVKVWESDVPVDLDQSTLFEADLDDPSNPEEQQLAQTVNENEELEVPTPEIPPHDAQIYWQGMLAKSQQVEELKQTLLKAVGRTSQEFPNGEPLVEEVFYSTGSPVALLVTISTAGEEHRKEALQEISQICQSAGVPEAHIHMGGRPVASSNLNQEVIKAAWNKEAPLWNLPERSIMLTSSLVGFVLSLILIRSFRLSVLILFVSIYTTIATLALVPATGGSMNLVLVVMPTLLFVLTLSGAIHLANYWRHAYLEDPRNAIVRAVKMAFVPCLLASFTTAIGLASLYTSTLAPVRDFGFYSAIGTCLSVVVVLYALPSLMQLWDGKTFGEPEHDSSFWFRFGNYVTRYHIPIVVFNLALFSTGIYGLRYFRTETKVIKYFPESSRIVQDYHFIEDNVTGIVSVDAIIMFDQKFQEETQFYDRMEIVRRIEQKLDQHDGIAGTISLTDFQPIMEKPPEDAPFFTKIKYNRRSAEVLERIKDGQIESASSFLTYAKNDADLDAPGDAKLAKTGDEIWRITAESYLMTDHEYGTMLAELETIVQSELAQSGVSQNGSSHHVVTGLVPIFLRTQQALMESLIYSFGMAFIVIAVVMVLMLQNVGSGLLSMLPNLQPIFIIFGAISLLGMRTDMGTMITASVALGIAVDGTLHLLTWFRENLIRGMTRQQAICASLAHCAPAMTQTSLIIAIGLSMLYPATLLLISKFGVLMAALIMMALFGDIVFLPALLAGPMGGIIERSIQGKKAAYLASLNLDEALPEAREDSFVAYSSQNKENGHYRDRNSQATHHENGTLDSKLPHLTQNSPSTSKPKR